MTDDGWEGLDFPEEDSTPEQIRPIESKQQRAKLNLSIGPLPQALVESLYPYLNFAEIVNLAHTNRTARDRVVAGQNAFLKACASGCWQNPTCDGPCMLSQCSKGLTQLLQLLTKAADSNLLNAVNQKTQEVTPVHTSSLELTLQPFLQGKEGKGMTYSVTGSDPSMILARICGDLHLMVENHHLVHVHVFLRVKERHFNLFQPYVLKIGNEILSDWQIHKKDRQLWRKTIVVSPAFLPGYWNQILSR